MLITRSFQAGKVLAITLSSCLRTNVSRGFHLLTSIAPNVSGSLVPNLISPSTTPKLLTPAPSIVSQVAGFKVKGRLKRRCKDCYFVMRQQRLYVICKTHPRHKQMSMKAKPEKSWILTHATQSKVRPY